MRNIFIKLFMVFCVWMMIVVLGALIIGALSCGDAVNVSTCMWGF